MGLILLIVYYLRKFQLSSMSNRIIHMRDPKINPFERIFYENFEGPL